MKERKYNLHDGQMGAAITVKVSPRSSRNEISKVLDDGTISIDLTVAQTEKECNQALIAFLADVLQVKSSQVEIVAGTSGNDKLVTIMDLDKETVQERIMKRLDN